jgi:catechol 2,3-dioxygenase-like lactoylglutathione lyase family enzyme
MKDGAISDPKKAQQPRFTVGMDHIGFTVPDMRQAMDFFIEVMGFSKITEIGPMDFDENWKRRYHIRQNAILEKIVMLRAGSGSSIELFQYHSPDRDMHRPLGDDVGWFHIGFYTDDIPGSVVYLKSKGIEIMNDPIVVAAGAPNTGETWVYVRTPWGLLIELVNYPDGKAYEKHDPTKILWSPKDNRTAE